MTEAPIPGGACMVRDAARITAAQRRVIYAHLGVVGVDRFREIATATADTPEGLADEIDLTSAEWQHLEWLGWACAVALLDSWTLPDPLPATVAEFGRLPEDLRSALQEATRREGARILLEA